MNTDDRVPDDEEEGPLWLDLPDDIWLKIIGTSALTQNAKLDLALTCKRLSTLVMKSPSLWTEVSLKRSVRTLLQRHHCRHLILSLTSIPTHTHTAAARRTRGNVCGSTNTCDPSGWSGSRT